MTSMVETRGFGNRIARGTMLEGIGIADPGCELLPIVLLVLIIAMGIKH
jgi:hypothetical protein